MITDSEPADGSETTAAFGDGDLAELRAAHVLAKPPVRALARSLGVDLTLLAPSGPGGVITRKDVEAAASALRAGVPARALRFGTPAPDGSTYFSVAPGAPQFGAPHSAEPHSAEPHSAEPHSAERQSAERKSAERQSAEPQPSDAAYTDREQRIPIKGVRRLTAEAMVASAFTAPHVTEWVQVDVTRTMKLVERLRGDPEFAGVKLSPLAVVALAMVRAVRRNPGINATWDGVAQEIVVKHYVNLGIAAATPRGLVVPNIKDADRLGLRDLAAAINALAVTAREGRSTPADLARGTITITNVGVFGVDAGTPILNLGEAAILAFGQVRRLPWVHKGRVVPRWVTTLALSFDHRLVDGDLGSRALADVAAVLTDPATALV
jgi:pyruvate dehydrogenase E2 component (dihydrolipoamide acetyltransferase)